MPQLTRKHDAVIRIKCFMDVVADIRMIVGLKFQNRKKSLGLEGEFSRTPLRQGYEGREVAKTKRGREIE